MATAVKPDRVPYAERDRQRSEFCTCAWNWHLDENGQPERRGMHSRDPKCKLHGTNVEEAPW